MSSLSLCMIVRNEERGLGQCLASVAPFVDEIIIVDTGSTDKTKEIALSFKAKVFDFNRDTHPDAYYFDDENSGTIGPWTNQWNFADFGGARNFSFDKATSKYILWIDADDVVEGGSNLREIVAEMEKDALNAISLKYDYHTDSHGNVTTTLWRERIIRRGVGIRWIQPVHEVLVPLTNQRHADSVKIVHHRHKVGTAQVPNRNLKILQRLYAKTKDQVDPRTLFYLGNEMRFVDPVKAQEYYMEYLKLSGWDEERGIARNLLGEIHEARGNYVEAFNHYAGAVADHPVNADGWFGLARVAYFREEWAKCERYTEAGFQVGNVELNIMTSPLDRKLRPHLFYNMALNRLGKVKEAIASCVEGLKYDPTQSDLLGNKKLYEDYLNGVQQAPKDPSTTGPTVFRLNEDLGEPPPELEPDIIAALCVQIWKQLIRAGETNKVHGLLAHLPMDLNTHPQIIEIKRRSESLWGVSPKEFAVVPSNVASAGPTGIVWKPYHRPPNYPRGTQATDVPVAVVTPHSQAWGVPETFVTEDLPLTMTTKQLQAMVGTIWSEYIAHDEILSAITFLKTAPYRVRHTALTEEWLRRTQRMTEWIQDEVQYDKGNTPTNSVTDLTLLATEMFPVSRANPTPIPGAGGNRYQWFTDRLPKTPTSIADLGCIDGEMSNRWGLLGHKVVGFDISTNSVKVANTAAEREQTGAVHIRTFFKDALLHVPPASFDYVISGDVYEHLLDSVNDILIPARKLVKPTGQFLMATPHGSWYRGSYNIRYHPWLWGEEGEPWNTINRNRAHVIAPTVWTVVENLRAAGFYVQNCTVVEGGYYSRDVDGQGNVFSQSFPNPPEGHATGRDIVFFLGSAMSPWTPHLADVTGQGGSEVAAIQMSRRLAALGHRVRVYSDCGEWGEGIYDGVEYRHTEKFHDLKCDVLVVSRQSAALDPERRVDAKVRLLWTHDVVPKDFTHERALRADKILALSQWHKNNIQTVYPFVTSEHIKVTRNGIDPARFKVPTVRNPHKVVYSSSPDRGLIALLQMWPKIRERVPDAELHVFYGFENWKKSAVNDAGQTALIAEIEGNLEKLKPLGVHSRGRVPQQDLVREFLQAGAWLYPTWFTETSCITAMEAQAAGLACVTSPIAALNETLGSRGTLIPGDWLSADYQTKFIEAAVQALLSTPDAQREALSKYALEHFAYGDLVSEWVQMFENLLMEGPSISAFKEPV